MPAATLLDSISDVLQAVNKRTGNEYTHVPRQQAATGPIATNKTAGRTPTYQAQVSLKARFSSCLIHQTNSRFNIQPAPISTLPQTSTASSSFQQHRRPPPAHRALAARLAAIAARQQQQQQQQQQQPKHSNVWTTNLLRDVRAVCREVGLSTAAADALAAAANKQQISANPGIMLSQLLRLATIQDVLGGLEALSDLIAGSPTLLLSDPDTLVVNLKAAQQLLGIDSSQSLIRRYPQFLACSPFRLQSNLQHLQQLLGCTSTAATAAVVAHQPLLLLSSPRSLQQRLRQLQQLLAAVPTRKLQQQLRKSPELLLLRPCTVAAKLKCIEQLFRGHLSSRASPRSSTNSSSTRSDNDTRGCKDLGSNSMGTRSCKETSSSSSSAIDLFHQHKDVYKHQLLQQTAQQLTRLRMQQELSSNSSSNDVQDGSDMRAAHLSSSSSSSSSNWCDPKVQHLVLKVPAVLSMNPATLQHHVMELQLLLGLQAEDVRLQKIVQLQPGLLTQSPATLANKLQLLQHLTGRPELAVQDMVLKCPAVLTLSVSNITGKWQLLEGCVESCRAWQAQLRQAAPVTVGMLLCYSTERLQRLQYLVWTAQEEIDRRQAGYGSSGSSRRRSSSMQRGSHLQFAAPAAGSSGSSSSSSARLDLTCAAQGATANSAGKLLAGSISSQDRQQQLEQLLEGRPWRSLVQHSNQRFCLEHPSYAAWQQQQQLAASAWSSMAAPSSQSVAVVSIDSNVLQASAG